MKKHRTPPRKSLPLYDTPLPQSLEFERMLKRLGRKTKRVETGAPLGCLMVKRRGIWFASRADLDMEGLAELRAQGLWLLNTERPGKAPGFNQIMTPAWVAELALTEDWLSKARQSWRTRLNKTLKDKTRVYDGDFDPHRDLWLLERQSEQGRARGFQNWPAPLTVAFAAATPGAAKMFWMEDAGTPCAGILILRHGTRATYHHSWSNEAGRKLDANRLLLHHAITWLRSQNVTHLDLGIIDTTASAGVTDFKLGSGARPRQLGGTWLANPLARKHSAPAARAMAKS